MAKDEEKYKELKDRYEKVIENANEKIEFLENALKVLSERKHVKVEVDGEIIYEGEAAAAVLGVMDDKKEYTFILGHTPYPLHLITKLHKIIVSGIGV